MPVSGIEEEATVKDETPINVTKICTVSLNVVKLLSMCLYNIMIRFFSLYIDVLIRR